MDLKHFGVIFCQFFQNFHHSITKSPFNQFSYFLKTSQIQWTVPNDFLAKKEQLFFYEDLLPIAASIKKGLPVLRSTIVLGPKIFLNRGWSSGKVHIFWQVYKILPYLQWRSVLCSASQIYGGDFAKLSCGLLQIYEPHN